MSTDTIVQACMDTIKVADDRENKLLEMCNLIIDASLYWTGEDEERNPRLKRMRTLAGLYLMEHGGI